MSVLTLLQNIVFSVKSAHEIVFTLLNLFSEYWPFGNSFTLVVTLLSVSWSSQGMIFFFFR